MPSVYRHKRVYHRRRVNVRTPSIWPCAKIDPFEGFRAGIFTYRWYSTSKDRASNSLLGILWGGGLAREAGGWWW